MRDNFGPDDLDSEPIRMGWLAWIVLTIATCGGLYYCYGLEDRLSMAAIVVVYLMAMFGFRVGFTCKVASLIGLTAAVMLAPQLGISNEFRFTQWFGTTGLMNRVIAIASIGILISGLSTLILNLIGGRVMRRRPGLARTNAWLGLGAGAVQAGVAILLFLGGLLTVEPMHRQMQQASANASKSVADGLNLEHFDANALFSNPVTMITQETRNSKLLGPVIEKYNPFEMIPQLNKLEEVQKTVRVLSDPGKIQEMMHHPSIAELQDEPQIKHAVQELMQDPELERVLQSGKGLDRPTIMRLLNHPAVMQLLDEPDFLNHAKQLIDESAMSRQIEI